MRITESEPDQEKLKHLCLQIPGGTTFPAQHEQGESEEEEEYIPSTEEVIGELSRSSVMSRKLTPEELSRFGFSSMEEISKFGPKIQSNLIWGMKLYLLLERAYKQTNAEIDASCCGILFCKAIEAQMQECFADALKHYFPDYQMRECGLPVLRISAVRYLKDASPEKFTLAGIRPSLSIRKIISAALWHRLVIRRMTDSGGMISGRNYSNAKTGETTAVIQNCSGGKILKPC